MKKGNSEPLSPTLRAELEELARRPDSSIDTSDMPEVADWSQARRRHFHPSAGAQSLTLDEDILEWFASRERDYQARINAVLRDYIEHHEA